MMRTDLDRVLRKIGEDFQDKISENSNHYMEVSIGRHAESLGYADVKDKFGQAHAVVPLKNPLPGLKVMIDGRTFADYAQFASGIAVPGYVAKESSLPSQAYRPDDSLILNFV
ncbi:MAG: hypothetical protein R2941_09780 [Desulfobacterales bacterium]